MLNALCIKKTFYSLGTFFQKHSFYKKERCESIILTMIESSSPLNTQMTSITRTCIFTPSHLICMLLSPFHHLLFLYSKESADIIGYMGHFLAYFLKRCRELKKTVTLLSNTFFSVKQKRKKKVRKPAGQFPVRK